MDKIRIFLLIVVTMTFAGLVQAQYSPGIKTVIPASPNATSLAKYGEIPVSMYTGVPQINVPLYTLKGRELEVPISLSYHAGGVRVEEIASWVGIGWSLNAGGVITRSIRGMPDDVGGGYFAQIVNGNGTGSAFAKKYMNSITPDNSTQLSTGNAMSSDLSPLESIRENVQDGQPDIYYFNFGKYSGSFFMNENGQFVCSPLEALKVEYVTSSLNNQGISRWVLTTPDGVRYVFGNTLDGTRVAWETNSNGTQWPYSTTGWYLLEIYSPHGDKITLNYTNVSYSYSSRGTDVLNVMLEQDNGGVTPSLPLHDKSVQLNNMTVPRLTSITSINGTVNFTAGASRTDLPGEKTLASVSIFANNNLANPLKSWQFNYDYFTNRLTLESLQEYSGDGSVLGQGYTFSYYGSLPNPDPNGTDINSQDLWGYYNGVTNTVFPQGYTTTSPQYGTISITGADRHSDPESMLHGMLTKITYPTGGTTQFDYEPNQVYATANSNIPAPGVPEQAGEVSYLPTDTWSQTFTIVNPDPTTGKVHATITAISMLHTCPFDNDGFSQCYYATLKGINGNSYPLTVFKDGTTTADLYPGTYVISGQGTNLSGQSGNVYRFYMTWMEYPPAAPTQPQLANQNIGGLRIKRISNFDGQTTNVTRYQYNLFGQDASSGVLVNQPFNYVNVFEQQQPKCDGDGAVYFTATIYAQLRGYPLIPLMPTQGGTVGYQNVTKLTGENGELGKEEYTFTTANDFPDEVQPWRPYAPNCSFDWRRGQLLHSTTYKNSNGNFIPVKATGYHYVNSVNSSAAYGLVVETGWQVVGADPNMPDDILPPCYQAVPLSTLDYFVGAYRTVSEFQYLQSDTTWLFDQNNPAASIQTIHYYTYDTQKGHYQLTSTVTTDSKNHSEEVDYSYPPDITLSGVEETARQNLVSNFILTPILDTRETRNGTLMRDMKNNYKVFDNGFALPENLDVQVTTNPVDRRVEFLQYDNLGNLTQQHKMNDVLNSYVWDYNQSYPIASVTNAAPSDIAYTSFEADGTGNWTLGAGSVNTTASITGRNSYNLTGSISRLGLSASTTYLVSYWSQSGALSIAGTQSGYPQKGKTISLGNNTWTLYVHKVLGQSTITVSGNANIDELRLYPAASQMTSYTFDPLVGMTSQTDVGNRVTYYEYDGLTRLMRIRDQDYNIVKTFEYQYKASGGCGSGCYIVPMLTMAGTNTIGYPVGVFSVRGKLLGNAASAADYVAKWNSDADDSLIGTLAQGGDALHFQLGLKTGQTLPAGVTGDRYYQYDLPWNILDGVEYGRGDYVDFGDSTGLRIPSNPTSLPAVMPPNTVNYGFFNQWDQIWWFIHSYPDTRLKTLTFYHSDDVANASLDNGMNPATSLTKIQNLRGNLPQQTTALGGSCFQQASAHSVANVTNWNSITSITGWGAGTGDGVTPCLNMNYSQDFMKNNRGLQSINTTRPSIYAAGYRDLTFKISRLKTGWNTYFSQLQDLEISDEHWDREDLSNLTKLKTFYLVATNQNHSNDPTSNPATPIPAAVTDNAINQIANGAGQNISNGLIYILTGGGGRSSGSNAAVNLLIGKGWQIYIDGNLQTIQ